MKIVWNQKAFDSLDINIEYLKRQWSFNELEIFLNKVEETVSLLQSNPDLGTIFESNPRLRRIVITKHISLFYEVDEAIIYLHLFWNNFQNPQELEVFFA